MTLDYGITDCDTHCYETRDAFTRYLPSAYRDRTITPVRDASGAERILAGRRIATFNSESGMGFDMAYRPGSLKEMLKHMASGHPDETYQAEPIRAEYLEREPRLRLLAEQGVDRCVVFPAGMALAAEHYVADTDALYVNLQSFNRWYNETWGFNYEDTLFATSVLSLRDLDRSIALTEEILAAGAKFVLLPTGPAYGRSPGDPYFDPVWSRLNEAEVTVAFHIMPYWYFDAISPAWGHTHDPASWHMSAWQWMNVYGERPIVDVVSALIFDNIFGRFPQLNVLVAEHGASWVPHMLTHMDKSRGMGRNGPWIGGKLEERPSAIFRRHVRVAPYPEDDIPRLVDELGGDSSCLVMGSDFPHAEGLAEPADFVKLLDRLDEETQRDIMYRNAAKLFAVMQPCEGRVALVTGASRGLGAAIATRLAGAGAKVVVTARTLEDDGKAGGSLRQIVENIRERGGDAVAIQGDLAVAEDRRRVVSAAEAAFGPIDILVNNAAVTFLMPFEEFTQKRFRLMIEVQAWAPYELSQLVIPSMKARGGGWILNITSRAAVHPAGPPFDPIHRGGFTVYGMVKAALDRFTTALAAELYADNIAVNALAPWDNVATPGAGQHDLVAGFPLENEEWVAEAALLLCSGDPQKLTGRVAYSQPFLAEMRRRPSVNVR